jgi:hypothetical protein
MPEPQDVLLERLTIAAMEFLVPLRQGDGFDNSKYSILAKTLQDAAKEWRGKADVPKKAAIIFVDIFDAVWSSSYLYGESEGSTIRQRADHLAALVRECVSNEQ